VAELWSQKSRRSLGNGSVNMFPRQPNHVIAAADKHATIKELLEAVGAEVMLGGATGAFSQTRSEC
jgi:hypothetical protein